MRLKLVTSAVQFVLWVFQWPCLIIFDIFGPPCQSSYCHFTISTEVRNQVAFELISSYHANGKNSTVWSEVSKIVVAVLKYSKNFWLWEFLTWCFQSSNVRRLGLDSGRCCFPGFSCHLLSVSFLVYNMKIIYQFVNSMTALLFSEAGMSK